MAENNWTKEQLEAITENGCNLLVAAAAGAGKTAVLVERIIRKITDDRNPVDIDKLLIVTFTNAAATEMRERIAEAISMALDKNPGSKILQKQLTLLNKASITTLHSFCLEVIKNNFQYIELDPNFRIANETEALLMKTEALDELFEDIYENEAENEVFFNLLECYGGNRDDQRLQEMVLTLFEFIQSYPWPNEWLETKTELFNLPDGYDFANTQWGKVLLKNILLELYGLKEMMDRALNVIKNTGGLTQYLPVFQEDISNIETVLKLCSTQMENKWDIIFKSFSIFEFGRLPACGKDVDKKKQEYVKSIRDDLKARIRSLNEEIFSADSNDTVKELNYLFPLIKCLSGLVIDFDSKYSGKKRRKFLLDFNDLEHFCLEILTEKKEGEEILPSSIAESYKERFEEVLVDEYQDSNLVQEIIIKMISKSDSSTPNVFMVGDVKQSIYRFRQAKPELFLEKYNTYSMEKGEKFRKVQLFKNFRSRKEVVDSVNFIFKQIMSEDVGELNYNDNEALNLGSGFEECDDPNSIIGGAAELHIVEMNNVESDLMDDEDDSNDSKESSNEVEEEEVLDSIQCEARIVVKRIKEIISPDENGKIFKVYDKNIKAYRKVEYKDIVILLRTTRNWSGIVMEELSSQGIAAYADSGAGFFKTVEVQIVLSLLQIIDNPLQDIPLLSVLRSPIASFSQDDLADVRLEDLSIPLYDSLKMLAKRNNGESSKKAGKFLECLEIWRNKALYMSTDELLWFLFTDTGFYSFAGAMPGGQQRQANLRILFERARQFEETSYKGLFNFINFINKLKGSKGDMGSAKILGENENVVRIMSIHKSKGLEFPVVILSGCGKRFNLQDMNKSMLLHQDLGFGPDFVDYKRRISYPSIPKQSLRYKIKVESLSEEMRILYVAFTRAKEKLIITGSVNNIEKAVSKWVGFANVEDAKLSGFDMLRGRNYLDWIGPALLRHRNCEDLRSFEGSGENHVGFMLDDQSTWEVRKWNKNDILTEKIEAKLDEKEFMKWLDQFEINSTYSEYSEEISRRLSWEYQYKKASEIPVKVSVTELKRRFTTEFSEEIAALQSYMPILLKKPAFLEESKGLGAAEMGTVLHFVMQHLDFNKSASIEEIKFQVGEMVFNELLTEQQAKTVDVHKVYEFITSKIGTRLLNSDKIYREIPFNMEVAGKEFYKDLDDVYNDETLLLQGVIDCYFEENDGIVLLDYKTDYVPPGKSDALREKYRLQIEYYTKALEQLAGKRVKGKYIYLFWNGEVIEYAT